MSAFLELDGVDVFFQARKRFFAFGKPPPEPFRAVNDVSLRIQRGEILGLVGESGCGKTTLTRAVMQLQPVTAGRILLEGRELSGLAHDELRKARLDFQMVFQDPYASLNPRLTVFSALAEAIQARRGKLGGDELKKEVAALMRRVGLSPAFALKYPHEFSGGQRQRIAIARALGPQPKLLLADEPVSALDVSIQSQILNLLLTLSRDLGLTMLFISHDLGVVRYIADRVAVMQAGKIVEQGDTETVMSNPQHPYTQTLLASAPGLKRSGQA
ncbi:MAG TPA: ATP-binding cassette domain-containing protein [Verrucomicrobiales bacterium]|nr:ATP-binding cassette domain-containing protein [Verrucomicrobiales bacterium]